MLVSPQGFAVQPLNQPGVQTHASGSIIDFVFHDGSLDKLLGVGDVGEECLSSDHACLVLTFGGALNPVQEPLDIGMVKWSQSEEWAEALQKVEAALFFVAGWAGLLMRSQTFRSWVASGSKRALRQKLLDRAIWWRNALVTMAGHVHGLVRLTPPHHRRNHNVEVRQVLNDLLGDSSAADPLLDMLLSEEMDEALACQLSPHRLGQLRDMLATDRSEACRVISSLIRPREKLQLAFNDDAGKILPLERCLQTLAENIEDRAQGPHPGNIVFNRQVQTMVRHFRAEALKHTEQQVGDPFLLEEVAQVCCSLRRNKASATLPLANLRAASDAGLCAAWSLCCLISVACVSPSSWFREVTPIRKKGPKVVSDVACLRPISYVGDLENLSDALWLNHNKQALEAYYGQEQHGGRSDATLVALGILVAAQIRKEAGLPTIIKKADLFQGYDLSWRDGTLVHLAKAGVKGRHWLAIDSAFSADHFRIKLGLLVGPIKTLSEFSIAQGKRSAVHLFNSLVRGLPDQLNQSCVGVGLGFTDHDTGRLLAGRSVHVGCNEPLRFVRQMSQLTQAEARYIVAHADRASGADLLVALDILAPLRVCCFQFVDDSFTLQSTVAGVNATCKAAETFCELWRHRFAGGSKGPTVLPVACALASNSFSEPMGGSLPQLVDSMKILGSFLTNT